MERNGKAQCKFEHGYFSKRRTASMPKQYKPYVTNPVIDVERGKLIHGFVLANGDIIYPTKPIRVHTTKPLPLFYGQKYTLK